LLVDWEAKTVKRVPLKAPRYIVLKEEHKQTITKLLPGKLDGHFVRVIGGQWLADGFVEKWIAGRHKPRYLQVIARPKRQASVRDRKEDLHAGMTNEKLFKTYIKMEPPESDLDQESVLATMLKMAEQAELPAEEVSR
jgi:hypothetical protein